VVEVVDGLDLSAMSKSYRGSGSASYHPAVLLSLLVYGCATGVFSSRKLERATYDSVAFRFIAANDHPDHDTIATFRRRFLKEIQGLFVKSLPRRRLGCCCCRACRPPTKQAATRTDAEPGRCDARSSGQSRD
jgi:transposase